MVYARVFQLTVLLQLLMYFPVCFISLAVSYNIDLKSKPQCWKKFGDYKEVYSWCDRLGVCLVYWHDFELL